MTRLVCLVLAIGFGLSGCGVDGWSWRRFAIALNDPSALRAMDEREKDRQLLLELQRRELQQQDLESRRAAEQAAAQEVRRHFYEVNRDLVGHEVCVRRVLQTNWATLEDMPGEGELAFEKLGQFARAACVPVAKKSPQAPARRKSNPKVPGHETTGV